ncbi:MAG: hypothetical protein JNK99_08010 [Candidatus Accumulibacter sp.]|jgi:transcriptional regulator NrdR family protein|uniref:hypothetical protein n=1 Tax=Accumulibacter sp. TaxID=2053492 RepID=UPI001A418C82|nr:hypothetical protein [Accumulibacter sp.]MBL8394678.1 hypothetical protein [Accumulibacter sp.]
MTCPNCHSPNVRRSQRRGLKEGTALRRKHLAPYRCVACGTRFIAPAEAVTEEQRALSIADYLGLTGRSRQLFTDHVILGGLTSLLLVLSILLFFSLAFGWIDPFSLNSRFA